MNVLAKKRWTASAMLIVLALTHATMSQTPGTGAISGVVTDPAGRVVVRADVVATSDATHSSRTVTTTPEGLFRLPVLSPGEYTVTVKVAGFAANTSRSIQVTVGQVTSLNVALAIAAAGETVQVDGNSQVAELESSTLGGLMDG
jgi:hypothetical protein